MDIKKIKVDGKEIDFVISSDDEVEENEKIIENDTLDLTDVVLDIKYITENGEYNE